MILDRLFEGDGIPSTMLRTGVGEFKFDDRSTERYYRFKALSKRKAIVQRRFDGIWYQAFLASTVPHIKELPFRRKDDDVAWVDVTTPYYRALYADRTGKPNLALTGSKTMIAAPSWQAFKSGSLETLSLADPANPLAVAARRLEPTVYFQSFVRDGRLVEAHFMRYNLTFVADGSDSGCLLEPIQHGNLDGYGFCDGERGWDDRLAGLLGDFEQYLPLSKPVGGEIAHGVLLPYGPPGMSPMDAFVTQSHEGLATPTKLTLTDDHTPVKYVTFWPVRHHSFFLEPLLHVHVPWSTECST